MLQAGKLDRRISLQSRTLGSAGDPTAETWTTEATVWAQKMDPSGTERFTDQMVAAEATQAYRIRYRADVEPTWRVLEGDEQWNVQAAFEGAGRHEETILLVKRFDPDDE